LDALYRGGIIHDIGKIVIPDAILLKPGPLSPDDLLIMRSHTTVGESIVRPLRTLADLLPIIRNHHEHFDGNGYPDGLAGSAIPRLARIVAVCDAYDALVTDRPYRKARSVEEAIATLIDGAGRQWDPDVVEVLTGELSVSTTLGAA
jgi:cyclic di-GMP phosphodiesterase